MSATGTPCKMSDHIVIINDFSVGGGGAGALAILSALSLIKRGYEVTFISGDAEENIEMSKQGVTQFCVGGQPLLATKRLSGMITGVFNENARRSVAAWITTHDTPRTIYHLHNWSQILSPSIFAALRGVGSRVIIHAHDYFLVCPNGAYAIFPTDSVCNLTPLSSACVRTNCDRRHYAHKLWRTSRQLVVNALRDIAKQHPPIIALHEGMVPLLERGGIQSSDIHVVRNPASALSDVRVCAENNKLFLFVGRLHEGKGPDLAAKAARLAGVPLCLIGDGPMRQYIEREFPEVNITGWLDQTEIAEWMKKARVLIVPSRYPEPFGIVAVEGLATGIPTLIASSALLAPEIEAMGGGFMCDPGNTPALAKQMKELANDDTLTLRMSQAAFDRSQKLATTTESWMNQLIRIYEERLDKQQLES